EQAMLRSAEEHAAYNTLPSDAAVPRHEAEVKKGDRQKEHEGRADAGIVLGPPDSDANVEDSVREKETARSEARPDEAPVSPDGGKERKPNEERVRAIDGKGSKLKAGRGSDIVDHDLGVGDEVIGATEQVDSVLLELMRKISNEQNPVEAG